VPNPPENTAQRSARLTAEARDNETEQNQVTTTASLYGRPDGVDDRIYDPVSGAVLDDGLTDEDQELFQEAVQEVDNEITDLGEGSFPGVVARPVPPAVRERMTRVPRRVKEVPAPAGRQVLERAPVDPLKQFVLVQALDDINASIGFNGGKTFELKRGKTYRVPRYAALWLIEQKYVGPPPQRNWLTPA
jgi:hypothetical protein